jgi:hypothetical protein
MHGIGILYVPSIHGELTCLVVPLFGVVGSSMHTKFGDFTHRCVHESDTH